MSRTALEGSGGVYVWWGVGVWYGRMFSASSPILFVAVLYSSLYPRHQRRPYAYQVAQLSAPRGGQWLEHPNIVVVMCYANLLKVWWWLWCRRGEDFIPGARMG